jgi:hypothetical protein
MMMRRQQLTDDSRWFDREAAVCCVEEGSRWNGNNHISLATGSQWDHEEMWLSRKGLLVIHTWSQYQGSSESWYAVTAEQAAEWLVRNERDGDDLPEGLLTRVADHLEASEA